MFTLIILNYKRPNNTKKIVDNMKNFRFIDEIIISNGDAGNAVNFIDDKIKIFDDYAEINQVYSLDSRFICGIRAKNHDLIIIDDDIYIEEQELLKVVLEYNNNPDRIVGCFGRNIDKGYHFKKVYSHCDIVLTKLLICRKILCSLFFMCKPLIEHVYKKGKPYGNGEDIFFSFISSIYFKSKNFCLKGIKTQTLEQNDAISKIPTHLEYRKELTSYLNTNYHLFESFIGDLKLIDCEKSNTSVTIKNRHKGGKTVRKRHNKGTLKHRS